MKLKPVIHVTSPNVWHNILRPQIDAQHFGSRFVSILKEFIFIGSFSVDSLY